MSSSQPQTASNSSAEEPNHDAPAVVAVVVAKDPGAQFDDMLYSLSEQDYENISVLVIDAGSDDPIAARVASILPAAYLHRIVGDPGWSVAANHALDLVSGSPFLMFCHDDVVLERSCVSRLMSEVYKSNAGIVGPKLVSWDDPRRLLQIGMGADRFGVPVPMIDKGEFDQEQYDSARDCFYVPGAVQLIRTDLLKAIGGFDEGISFLGEDLDLCWRAHALGARVRVVPKAKAKHIESVNSKVGRSQQRRLATRHRIRSVLANTSSGRWLTIPLAVFLVIIEAIYALFNGRRRHARDLMHALGWNFSRLASAKSRRKILNENRKLSDSMVREKQAGGSAQISNFWREKFEAGQSRLDSVLSTATTRSASGGAFQSLLLFAAVLVLILFASRGLIVGGYKVFGQIPFVESSTGLLREWLGGHRTAGVGGESNSPLAYLVLGIFRGFFFYAPGIFNRLLLLLPIIIGFWGASRLAKPFESPRVRAFASALYVLNPILFWMLRAGRWDSLVIWAGLPFLVGSLLKLAQVAPFADRPESEDNYFAPRTTPVRALRLGVLVTAMATFAPSAVVVAVVAVAALAIASIIHFRSFQSYLLGLLAVIAVPVVLHIPWSFEIVREFSWDWLVGSRSPERSELSILEIIGFQPNNFNGTSVDLGIGPSNEVMWALGLVLPVFGALSILFSPPRRARLLLSGLAIAFAPWLIIWLDQIGALPFAIPATESLMALAAVGLLLVISTSASEAEQLYAKSVSRLRMVLVGVSSAGLVVLFLGGSVLALAGDWTMPDLPRRTTASSLFLSDRESEVPTTGRILWLGEPGAIPLDTHLSDLDLSYAVSDDAIDVRNKWVPGPVGRTAGVGKQVDLAYSGGTANLGGLLSSYGIKYVILVEQLASDFAVVDTDSGIRDSLERQVDLRIDKAGSPKFTIFRNTASGGIGASLTTDSDLAARTAAEQLEVGLDVKPVSALPVESRPGRWTVDIPDSDPVHLAVGAKGLSIRGGTRTISEGFDRMTVISAGEPGVVELSYPISYLRLLLLTLQFFVVSTAIVIAQTRKGSEL